MSAPPASHATICTFCGNFDHPRAGATVFSDAARQATYTSPRKRQTADSGRHQFGHHHGHCRAFGNTMKFEVSLSLSVRSICSAQLHGSSSLCSLKDGLLRLAGSLRRTIPTTSLAPTDSTRPKLWQLQSSPITKPCHAFYSVSCRETRSLPTLGLRFVLLLPATLWCLRCQVSPAVRCNPPH